MKEFIKIVIIGFLCAITNNPILALTKNDIAGAQMGYVEEMTKVRTSLENAVTTEDLGQLYYWTAKLCAKKVLNLEYPAMFINVLEANQDDIMLKTVYAYSKLKNIEGIKDKEYDKQRDLLLYQRISPEEFTKNVSSSPIYKNILLGLNLLKSCAPYNSYAAQELAEYYLLDESLKDWDEAIKYYKMTLESNPNNAKALSTLAHCYFNGYGVPQDLYKARAYWEKLYSWDIHETVYEHFLRIDYMLGKMYYEGLGGTKDEQKAIKILADADKDGDMNCAYYLGEILYKQKDYDNSFKLFEKAQKYQLGFNGQLGDIYRALSRAYRFGHGVDMDQSLAEEYWEKAKKFDNEQTVVVEVLNNLDKHKPTIIHPEMVFVKGGKCLIGATKEQKPAAYKEEYPAHEVTVEDFYIGKYEVTQKEWESIMGYNPSENIGENLPVDNVSWVEAKSFIDRLNSISGENYYLPSEAEWEYAARGGTNNPSYRYIGGDELDNIAWHSGNSSSTSHPVGTKSPNSLGIYDMAGNVWEWCENGKSGYGANTEPNISDLSKDKVRRGGSYTYFEWGCRAAFRGSASPGSRVGNTGLRLCKKASK